jgi:hypothetical protein
MPIPEGTRAILVFFENKVKAWGAPKLSHNGGPDQFRFIGRVIE